MEYLIEIGEAKKQIILGYDDAGTLCHWRQSELTPLEESQVIWLLKWLENRVKLGELLASENEKIRITPIEEDLSFERFWNMYNYKVGNIKQTRKLWDALSKEERAKALVGVRKYNRWIAEKNNMEKPYGSTFLNQRRWEGDYKI